MNWMKLVAQRFRAPALMERMFERLGIRDTIVQQDDAPRLMQGAAMRCLTCGEMKACQKLLAEAETIETPPNYCRNASLILRLQEETRH